MRKALILFGIVTLVIAGYFLFPTIKDVVINTPTPTPDPYAGWNTYTNEEYGFSFRYPKDWYDLGNTNLAEGEIMSRFFSDIQEPSEFYNRKLGLNVFTNTYYNQGNDAYWSSFQEYVTTLQSLAVGDSVDIKSKKANNSNLFIKIRDFRIDHKDASLFEVRNGEAWVSGEFSYFRYVIWGDDRTYSMFVPNQPSYQDVGAPELIPLSNEDLVELQDIAQGMITSVTLIK